MLSYIASENPTEMTYVKRLSDMKDVTTEKVGHSSEAWKMVLMYQSM